MQCSTNKNTVSTYDVSDRGFKTPSIQSQFNQYLSHDPNKRSGSCLKGRPSNNLSSNGVSVKNS